MSSTSSAVLYHAGPLGYILEVTASGIKKINPRVVVISDRSGSMRSYSSMIMNQAIPDALTKMGLSSDTEVTIITFDSYAERIRISNHDPIVDQLRTISADSQGGTMMAGVIPILKKVFTEISSDVPVSIIVISDGDVSDINETVRAMSNVAESIKARPGPISVSLYRLMTGARASPDTRALATIGITDCP